MNIDNTEQKDFCVKLPLVGGGDKDFAIKPPKGRVAREFYRFKRKTAQTSDDTQDRIAYEAQLDAERLKIKAQSPKDRDKKRLAEIAKEYEALEEQKDKGDSAYFDSINRTCHAILDSDIPFEKIDWEEADRREINGALGFFQHSVNTSSFVQPS